MSNYTQTTFFAPKDALLSGNPLKLIKGADVDPELAAIATAIASKYDGTNFLPAAPSAEVGLTAVAGTSSNWMRADAAPAIDQSVAPTWTGQHTFNGAFTTFANSIEVNGAGTSLEGTVTVTGSGATLSVLDSGANGARLDVIATNAKTSLNFSANVTATPGSIQMVGTDVISISTTRNVTIDAPSSGVAVTINGLANQNTALIVAPNTAGQSFGLTIEAGSNASDWALDIANAAGSTMFKVNGAGNATINAPTSGAALSVTGPAGNNAIAVFGSTTISQSFGISINGGTNSSDAGFRVFNAAATAQYFGVRGDGVVQGNDGTNLLELGYKDTPLNTPGGSYTLAAADRGKTINVSGGATITVPNGVFPAGAVVSFLLSSGTATIGQGSGFALLWAGNGGASGSRTLTGAGLASVIFQSSGQGLISGAGLS